MITVAKSPAHLAATAATFCASYINETVNRRGRCSILLAGGTTPQALYEHLSRVPYADNLPWAQVLVAFGDERMVPPTDERSNQRMAARALLDAVPIPPTNILAPDSTLPPAEAAAAYEADLRAAFATAPHEAPAFDLVLLGVGADGHTASLFPGMAAVRESQRWVVDSPAPAAGQPGRLTVTLPVLNAARLVVFLVQGADKAAIVRQVLGAGSATTDTAAELPARLVRPTGSGAEVKWFLDEAAAADLR